MVHTKILNGKCRTERDSGGKGDWAGTGEALG